jgi:hypothetical protein
VKIASEERSSAGKSRTALLQRLEEALRTRLPWTTLSKKLPGGISSDTFMRPRFNGVGLFGTPARWTENASHRHLTDIPVSMTWVEIVKQLRGTYLIRALDCSICSEVYVYHNTQNMTAIVAVRPNVILGRQYLFSPQIEPPVFGQNTTDYSKKYSLSTAFKLRFNEIFTK